MHPFGLAARAAAVILAVMVSVARSAVPASSPLPVANASFEDGDFVDAGGGYANLDPGATNITGWTVINHTISWAHVPNADGIGGYDGNYFLDLTGPGAGIPGGVTQDVNTTPGQEYSVTLGLLTINVPVEVEVDAGSSSTFFTEVTPNSWGTFSFLFQATDPVTPFTIQGISGYNMIGVDAPEVAGVPEPTGLGFAAAATLALLRRRHR